MTRSDRGLLAPMFIALVLSSPLALAGDYSVKTYDHTPTAQELEKALTPAEQAAPEGFRMRGIKKPTVMEKRPSAVALQVQFEFNKYELTPGAREVLDNLGTALQSPGLRGGSFLIEGHTDDIGSDAYNMQLSEQRANSVKRYLVSKFNIDESSLRAVGRGKSAPLDPLNPSNAINRRVQIINLH